MQPVERIPFDAFGEIFAHANDSCASTKDSNGCVEIFPRISSSADSSLSSG